MKERTRENLPMRAFEVDGDGSLQPNPYSVLIHVGKSLFAKAVVRLLGLGSIKVLCILNVIRLASEQDGYLYVIFETYAVKEATLTRLYCEAKDQDLRRDASQMTGCVANSGRKEASF